VVPVPVGGQDAQLEQIREMQARLDEEAGQLVQLRQNIRQKWAGRAPTGEARHLAQDVQHRIADDARARLPPASSGVSQNLAAAAILFRAMPEPSTAEGRRIQGELKNLLEDAAVQRTKSSASRRQGYPPEHRRDFPIHVGSLGPHRAHAGHSACGPGSPRQRAPPPQPPSSPRREGAPRLPPQAWGTLQQRGGSEPFARTTRSAGFQPSHTKGAVPDPVLNADYHHQVLGGRQGRNCGSRTTGWPASWVERTMTTSSSATSPCSSPTPPEPGWSICLLRRSPTGTTWSKPSPITSRAPMCTLGTPRISKAAASNRESPCGTTSGDFRSSASSCPTSPTQMSSAHSSPAPLVATW
jgi:hypothetical protein